MNLKKQKIKKGYIVIFIIVLAMFIAVNHSILLEAIFNVEITKEIKNFIFYVSLISFNIICLFLEFLYLRKKRFYL
jgi:hypothetical protein